MAAKWLKDTVFYEIYPQSFNDTNGDGIGDIPGITEKLDYIKSLGCNALWINPCYDSPFKDAGYDVRDYKKVAPRYGTRRTKRASASFWTLSPATHPRSTPGSARARRSKRTSIPTVLSGQSSASTAPRTFPMSAARASEAAAIFSTSSSASRLSITAS